MKRMTYEEKQLVEKICIGICDGYAGRCQRYPDLSLTCEDFGPLRRAYELGRKDERGEWAEKAAGASL